MHADTQSVTPELTCESIKSAKHSASPLYRTLTQQNGKEARSPRTLYEVMDGAGSEVISLAASCVAIRPCTAASKGTESGAPLSGRHRRDRRGMSRSMFVEDQQLYFGAPPPYVDGGGFEPSPSWCDSLSIREVRVDPPKVGSAS